MRFLSSVFAAFVAFAASPLLAGFDRPIPQAQSATAELWFGLACVALIAALFVVHRVVSRR